VEPGGRRRPVRQVRQEPLRREAGLDLIRTRQFSLPTFNWLRYPQGDYLTGLEPTPGWPLDTVLEGAAAAGFPAVGLDLYTLRGHVEAGGSIDELAVKLGSRGLACSDVGVLPIGTPEVRSTAETLAHIASVTGARTCIAAFLAPVEHAQAVAELKDCADVLAGTGTRLALEFVAYGSLSRLADAVALCEAVGWERCGLLVDTWHFFRTDAPWPVLRSLDGEQIALVHVNDGAAVSSEDPVFDGRFRRLPVGAGNFPLDEFARALDDVGYRGVLSTEVLSDEIRNAPPAEGARRLVQSLLEAWPS
jgi:sugar phosphate isomerase/epimerase